MERPLILTLRLDPESQRYFDAIRQRFFPPALNFLQAHITLFHKLPGEEQAAIEKDLQHAVEHQKSFPVAVTAVRNLGKGVAYTLEASVLLQVRAQLADLWSGWLTAQDKQKFQPHLTVQNKVSPEEARNTLAVLGGSFRAHTVQAVGLDLWSYEGGPWAPRGSYFLK